MKHRSRTIAAAALALAAGPARADETVAGPHVLSANIGIVSQYVFRGLTQTNGRPALQGGVDYFSASGAYAGAWLSNVNWVADVIPEASASLEMDFYAGFRKTWESAGIAGDFGYVHYRYPGAYPALPAGTVKPHSNEAYAAIGWRWASLKYSRSLGNLFGVEDSTGSGYLDLTVAMPLSAALSLVVHAGRQTYDGASETAALAGADNDALFGYEDYRATLSYAFDKGWTAAVTFTATTAGNAGYRVRGRNLGDDQVVIALLKTL